MTNEFSHSSYDVIVVGARCAGAATALLLARVGARVLIVDRDAELHDTLSTHALMRPAVSLLDRWGLLDSIVCENTPRVTGAQFHYGSERVDVPVKPDGEIDGLYAPRRWLLDRILRDAAVAAGAELHAGTSLVETNMDDSGRITGAKLLSSDGTTKFVSADMVVGADGRLSKMAESVGARTLETSQHRAALAYGYVDGIDNEGYRYYFDDRIFAGLIPTTNGAHCVFGSCPPQDFRAHFEAGLYQGVLEMVARWEPQLAAQLSQSTPLEPMRRFLGAPGYIRECAGPGWALVGDAGYFKDPATAHGITDAFLDADRLTQALLKTPGDASTYQIERNRFATKFLAITQKIASFEWDFETLKALHVDLNACMKAEHPSLADGSLQHSIAA